ncbi:hypothetical protein DB43_HL00210 [Parachlamydia acanthamoebae]|uniref:Uncharacterized protein n=1 Tax=Parachlamydia acanthamoebae TaxID=83552 RepID=A0A0C1E5Y7_9BACT|nr:hypothetical protein DB43_HL00210 [Parachlamydia acanthamoebae]
MHLLCLLQTRYPSLVKKRKPSTTCQRVKWHFSKITLFLK